MEKSRIFIAMKTLQIAWALLDFISTTGVAVSGETKKILNVV